VFRANTDPEDGSCSTPPVMIFHATATGHRGARGHPSPSQGDSPVPEQIIVRDVRINAGEVRYGAINTPGRAGPRGFGGGKRGLVACQNAYCTRPLPLGGGGGGF